MDFNSLIGLTDSEAKQILIQNGYSDIEIKINSKHDEKFDALLVCAAKEDDEKVILICGEFCLDIKR